MTDPNVPPQPDPNQPPGQPGYGQQPQQPPAPPQQPPAAPQQPQPGYQQQPAAPGYNQPQQGYGPPQGGYQQQPAGGGAAQPFNQSEENMWSMLSHLIPIISIICIAAFKDRSARVNANAKEALNFQITAFGVIIGLNIIRAIFIAIFISNPWSSLWGVASFLSVIIGAVSIVWLVFAIIAAVKCYQGENYRYPFALRLIK